MPVQNPAGHLRNLPTENIPKYFLLQHIKLKINRFIYRNRFNTSANQGKVTFFRKEVTFHYSIWL